MKKIMDEKASEARLTTAGWTKEIHNDAVVWTKPYPEEILEQMKKDAVYLAGRRQKRNATVRSNEQT